jgi:hypothetical protein
VSKENYLKVAKEAASLERAGSYKPASEMWEMAVEHATTNTDTKWCRDRAEICKFRAEKRR